MIQPLKSQFEYTVIAEEDFFLRHGITTICSINLGIYQTKKGCMTEPSTTLSYILKQNFDDQLFIRADFILQGAGEYFFHLVITARPFTFASTFG